MDIERKISGQESSQELRLLQNEARQVTNPADGGLAGREAGRGEQTLPIHLSGPVCLDIKAWLEII